MCIVTLRRVLSAIVLGAVVAGAGEAWETDWAKARERAAAESRPILVEFTGSDWCGWCVRLKKEVLDQEAFVTYAAGNLVLMEADYPRQTPQSPELKAQNASLQKEFGVTGFPTLFLVDAEGRPFARTAYRAGGAEAYVEHLKALVAIRGVRDAALAKAAGAAGLERAQALVEAMTALPIDVLRFYAPTIAEIQTLDPENRTGFRARLAEMELMEVENGVRRLGRSGRQAEALALVDAFIAKHAPAGELHQKALLAKLGAYPINTKDGLDALGALVDEALAIDAATPTGQRCIEIRKRLAEAAARLQAAPAP